jgi:hypothetical protein
LALERSPPGDELPHVDERVVVGLLQQHLRSGAMYQRVPA